MFIVEGEKCASALRSLGFIAFTSSGGAGNAFSTDWTPCSGLKSVIIIPDNDEPGKKYCTNICSALHALDKPPQIFKVELRGIQEGEDILIGLSNAFLAGIPIPP